MKVEMTASAAALLAIVATCQMVTLSHGSSTSSYCMENYYFASTSSNGGYCVGFADLDKKISYKSQFYDSKNKSTTYCSRKYPDSRAIIPAVLRNNAQVKAMKKAVVAAGVDVYTGWQPSRKYQIGPVKQVVDPTSDKVLTSSKLANNLGVTIYWGSSCKKSDYGTGYAPWSGSYVSDGYSSDFLTYTSSTSDSYSSYKSSSYDDEPYGSELRACFYNYPIMMKSSGAISVVALDNAYSESEYAAERTPVCMYPVSPRSTSTETCSHLLGYGSCLFENPADATDTTYEGDYLDYTGISEDSCLSKCKASSYCFSYNFFGDSTSSGLCRLFADHPVKTKTNKTYAVRYCVDLRVSSNCNNHVLAETSESPTESPTPSPIEDSTTPSTSKPTLAPTMEPTKPTKSPTMAPTLKPTNYPTPEPTQRPTNFPTERPTKNPTPLPTSRPTKPTPAPTLSTIPSNVDEYPACPNAMILAQCYYEDCEPKCSDSVVSTSCFKKANRVCITLPDPQDTYTYEEESEFLKTYCRCDKNYILDEASWTCVSKASSCPKLASYSWSNKCTDTDANQIVELNTQGEWVELGTNPDSKTYAANMDQCWIIQAPEDGVVTLYVNGETQKNVDILEVYEVLSPSLADIASLQAGEVDTMLVEEYSGKVKKSTLTACSQQMILYFRTDSKMAKSGFDLKVMYT